MESGNSALEYTKSKSDSDFSRISENYEKVSLNLTSPGSVDVLAVSEPDGNLQKLLDAEMIRSRRLQDELRTERMKNQGLETIFQCIQEERQENKKLMTSLTRQKHTIKKLKKQLQQLSPLPDQTTTCRDEVSDISEGDESSAWEFNRRKYLMRQEYENRECQHKSAVDELQKQITQLELEKKNLSILIESSPDERLRQILNLHRELQATHKSNEANTVRCQTLSEETVQLKRQLGEMIDTCRQLMQSLDQQQKQQTFAAERAAIENNKQLLSDVSVTSDEASLISNYKQQKANLEAQLKEVVSMNARWQQYNEQREEYVQQLLQRVMELEQALIHRGERLSTSQQEQIDRILIQQKQKLDIAEETKTALELENRKLKRIADELRHSCQQNDGPVASFKAQLEKCTRDLLAERDNCQMLNAQIQMNQEDFRCERRDRERAQGRIEQLEQDLATANQQLAMYGVTAPRTLIIDQRTRFEHFRRDPDRYAEHAMPALVGRGVTSSDASLDDSYSERTTVQSEPTD